MSRLVALYPRAWRDRYEVELLNLMTERPPTPRDRFDIVRGAVDARLHPQVASATPDGSGLGIRIGGALGVVGGSLWVAASLAFHGAPLNLDLGYKESGYAFLIAVAAGLITGLSAVAISGALPGRRSSMMIAALVILLGAAAMAFPWPIVVFGYFATLLGIVVFGMIGAASGLGPFGILVAILTLLAFNFNTEDDRALLMIPLGVAWIVVGAVLGAGGMPAKVNLGRLRAALQPPSNSI